MTTSTAHKPSPSHTVTVPSQSPDGVTLTMITHTEHGDLVQTQRWHDEQTAEKHYPNVLRDFEERAADSSQHKLGSHSWQRPTRLGTLAFVTLTGRPMHRLPRAMVRVRRGKQWRLEVGCAWLRRINQAEFRANGIRA